MVGDECSEAPFDLSGTGDERVAGLGRHRLDGHPIRALTHDASFRMTAIARITDTMDDTTTTAGTTGRRTYPRCSSTFSSP